MIAKYMNDIRYKICSHLMAFALCLIVLSPKIVCAQSTKITVTGTVMDIDKNPIVGATVVVSNTYFGVITDSEGRYTISGDFNDKTVFKYSFMGYAIKYHNYKGDASINITLIEEKIKIDEVVVSARQNINDIDIRAKSGVVERIYMKNITSKPMIDMALALQGAIPGLTITNTGELGSKPKVRIRGTSSLREGDIANEPLYVMDGKVISAETFFDLDPNDIKDIVVLKDAVATALYGIKAANGVLEITSQRGIEGKPIVTYNFEMGVTLKGRRGVEMMDSEEKLDLERLLKDPATPGYLYSEDYYRKYHANDANLEQLISSGASTLDSLKDINTDWFDELIKSNLFQKHSLSVKGGDEQTTYYLSTNYVQQGGRIPGNDKQRISMRLNLDNKLGDWGYALLSVNGGYSSTNTPNGSTYDVTSLVYQLNPYEQANNNKLYSYPNRSYNDLTNQFSSKSTSKIAGLGGSINASPIKGLDISAVIGLDFVLDENVSITPSTAYSEQTSGIAENERGIYSKSKNTNTNISSNVRITYNKVFAEKHSLTLGANSDYYSTILDNLSIRGYGIGKLTSASAINNSIEGNRKPRVGSQKQEIAQMGIGAIMGYSFDNKYDLFATYKTDASSILPSDKRWNTAWAIGAGWTISECAFLKENKTITQMNLKGSYGQTANLNGVGVESSVGTFSYSQDYYDDQRILELIGIYNSDLKPEQSISINVGLTFELYNRVNLGLNWYNRTTHEALLDVPIPSSSGFATLKRNIGVLENQGLELTASARLIDNNDFSFTLGGNIAYNRNKVLDLYYTDKMYLSDDAIAPDYEIGKPYNILYGYKSVGINPITGLPIFLDVDGQEVQADEKLNREDVVSLGHTTSPYTGSVNLGFTYKNFDLNASFYYEFGGVKTYNYSSYVRDADNANMNAVKNQLNDMWFNKGDEGKKYHTPFYSSQAIDNLVLLPNTLNVGSSNYMKLSMLSLRYRLPSGTINTFFRYTSFALQASNLFTFSSYGESNPEGGTLAGTQQPIVTLSVRVSF